MQILSKPSKKTFKTKQTGNLIVSGTSNHDITIAPIDISKSIIIPTLGNTDVVDYDDNVVMAEIVNSTTIRFSKAGTNTTVYVNYEVVEFNNVKSLQRGTTVGTAYFTAISSIEISKTLLLASIKGANASATWRIQDQSNLYTQRTTSGSLHYQVIEFK